MRTTAEFIRQHLRLEGEDIIRSSTGKVVKPGNSKSMVVRVHGRVSISYHCAKFALAHGWLPVTVDHEDRDRKNNLLSNLRPATYQQQNFNRGSQRRKHNLPHGVYPNNRGRRYRAFARIGGRTKHFGSFDTPEEASSVVEAALLEDQGEFYRHHNKET